MPKSLFALFCLLSFHSFSQVIGGRNNSETTPSVSKPSTLNSGVYSGDVNLFSGDYNSSIQLGTVATPSGLSYNLSLDYSSSFAIGNTMPISRGIPYGEGWNLNIPTISVETEVFDLMMQSAYCSDGTGLSNPPVDTDFINFSAFGTDALKEGDVYWFSPYINIPGVASGRAIFKYIDVNDDKTAVFELNAFENHVEIRYNSGTWTVIASDGTRYTFRTAIQSYNAPANKRVLFYNQYKTNSSTNEALTTQNSTNYENNYKAGLVENSILPKQKYNLWYCDVITHRNQPLQGINFTYKAYGAFNYFKEFDQESYKYAAVEKFASSTFAKDHDFTCYSDLLLQKVEAISIDGLVDRLELKYATDQVVLATNFNEFIDYNDPNNGRLDDLYSYQTIFSDGKGNDKFDYNAGWKRYEHTKANPSTNPNPVNPVDPYKLTNGYVRSNAVNLTGGVEEIPFDHSFIESPRLMKNKLYPGDIYEVRSKIKRSNAVSSTEFYKNAGTFDMRIVTGDLQNPRGLDTTHLATYDGNTGIYFAENNYHSSRSKVLYSTFNMGLKWTLNYGEGVKEISNLFVMPNIPSKYQGFNFQIGPGNSDMNYNAARANGVYNSVTGGLEADEAYFCKYGNPSEFALTSASDIPGNFGVGLPWNMLSPIYKYMISHQNIFNYVGTTGKEAYRFWWNNDPDVLESIPTSLNIPTKLDNTVRLDEFELIRYSKNPWMLVGVNYYKVNGDVGGLVETGLKLISQKKLEYTSQRCRMLQNYAYQTGDSLQYRTDVYQVVVLLKAVREVPLDWISDTTQLLTTFFSYSTFHNNQVFYAQNQPMNGHFGMVLTKIVDYLGGITKIEYYPANDPRTRYTGAYLQERSYNCGVTSDPGYGLSKSYVVHPIVKYVLKNDEDDLVLKDSTSSNTGHKRWFYDFDNTSRVSKSTSIRIMDLRFYNGRGMNFDAGFTRVSVYGPSLIEGSSEYVNRTDYVHYGGDFDYMVTFPTIEEYLYHGKLKSVKEYDVNNKLFTEKLINYEYTQAYKNGYTRPNPYREDFVWEQEYDNPGLQYEYRDYYLNQPVSIEIQNNSSTYYYYGSMAYPYLDIPAFKGTGDDFELPKYLEFEFYPILDTTNPSYMFHSYFVKKKEEINRKYDDYLYKQAIVTGGTLPAPNLNTGPDPFGTGFTNPVIYSAAAATYQIGLINSGTQAAITDSLLAHSPLMDTVLFHVINTNRLADDKKLLLLLTQGRLSNVILNTLIDKYGRGVRTSTPPSPSDTLGLGQQISQALITNSLVSIVHQQSYISDEVLSATVPKISTRSNHSFISALFRKNDYLSDQVIQSIAGASTGYFNRDLFDELLSNQPQFSETAINQIINSRYLTPATLKDVLKNQVITDANYVTMINNPSIGNDHIVEVIETGRKYPSVAVFDALMYRIPAFSQSEMERIIAVADRDIEPTVLAKLTVLYGNQPFLANFTFTGNPLDAYCNNAALSGWSYIETKTSYEYYEADYKGTSNGRAYKVLMGLEDIPGRVVSASISNSNVTKTVNSLRLKHEPSWQIFSVTNTSTHLPTAKDEKQYFYLYDLKNRYDRYWYNYDLKTIDDVPTQFYDLVMNNNKDTLMFDLRWDTEYTDGYWANTPVLPKYDGMIRSKQYGMRSTPFQQTHITKNARDSRELKRSEYYFYDSRWVTDPFSVAQTVEYDGPSCPETGAPPANPAGCASCTRWKYGTEQEFLNQLPFNYCLWKDPVIGYFACPSSVNYAACFAGVELIDCNPSIPEQEEEGGTTEMVILTDALKKTLQLRSTVIQLDTIMDAVSNDFRRFRFDRSNTHVADFQIAGYDLQNTDNQGFVRPFRMVFPYDTLTTTKILKRNQHLQPALISNQVGLLTKFYYNKTFNKWNVDTNCTNPQYSFYYNYSSVETFNIGLPVRVTVGYMRPDSLTTAFEFTNDGQVKKMTTSSGHMMEYAFDGLNRLKSVTENGNRLLSRNEYQLWKHDKTFTFKERTAENYVYSVLYQNASDTVNTREFQKTFMDPLGRTAAVVKAYKGWGNIQISSGTVVYDNWGRPQAQYKPVVSYHGVTSAATLPYEESSGNLPRNETRFENDPISLDIKHADPGESISGWNTVNKQTWITNATYLSCELRLNRTELDLIMNASPGSFRFLRTRIIDQDGKESITYTNAMGQTVAIFASANMAQNVRTLYVYDSYGNLMKTINGERQHTDYQYNMIGQLVRETNVDGGEKRYIYNKYGKISGVQDQLDRTNVSNFDIPEPRFRKFEYDIYGNPTSQTLVEHSYRINPFCFENKIVGAPGAHGDDGFGNEYYFDYTFSNRMTQDWLNEYKTLNPLGGSTEITASGLPTMNALSAILEKSMTYGVSQVVPASLGKLTESYAYSPAGNIIQKIVYTYNSEDLLASQVITQHPVNIFTNNQFLVKATISYPAYNFRGALLEEKLDMGSDGSTDMNYFYTYDPLNRLENVFAARGNVNALANATLMSAYAYDDARGTISIKSLYGEAWGPSAQKVTYSYDVRDRLNHIQSTLFHEQLYYDDALIPSYNNQMSVTQYDAFNGNIKGIKVNYNFSTASNSIPLFAKETIYGYEYDRINRLVTADALIGDFIDAQFGNSSNFDPSESFGIGDESWGYDRIGNIIGQSKVLPGPAVNIGSVMETFMYTYANGTNHLTKVEDQISFALRNYKYDANGNLTYDSHRVIDGTGYMRGSYPHHIIQGADESFYLYDNADQRIAKKVVTSAQTTQEMYIKDAMGRDLSIVTFSTIGGTTTKSTEYFVYGTDRVARIATSNPTPGIQIQPDEATFFLYDHVGNTRVAFRVDNSNVPEIINALDYYSYGKILREYQNGPGDRYLTTQHERDKETGLDYRGARYYDSDIARFLSTDPWADKYPAWSTYNYVMGNPLKFIDPTGKGVEYTKEQALAMAARGVKNGYKTEVVANPDKPNDYGVNYKKTVDGKKYEGVQYEGKFDGIVGGGLQKYSGTSGGFSDEVDLAVQIQTSIIQGAAQTVVDEGAHKYIDVAGLARDAHIPGAMNISKLAGAAGGLYSVGDKLSDTFNAAYNGDWEKASEDGTVAAGYAAATIMMCAPTGVSQIAGGIMFIGFAIYDVFND